jgi:hypothetical protein
VPPKSNLLADVDAALVQKILHVPKRKWEPKMHHNGQTDDLGARLEVAKGAGFCYPVTLVGANPASNKVPLTLPQDEITITLAPGEYTKIKATMEEGVTLTYAWTATGGRVNFDLHTHAGSDAVTDEKGRGKTSGEGSFEAPFAGDHGWFWRNRNDEGASVTLQLRGDYSEIVRSE